MRTFLPAGGVYFPSQNDGHHIFVFGSNLSGRHGAGAAIVARQFWGAVYGAGAGLQGNSYAITTKNKSLKSRSLFNIEVDVLDFIIFAKAHPELIFLVTRIGCGLAGYSDADIAPMFRLAPDNCVLPEEWKCFL